MARPRQLTQGVPAGPDSMKWTQALSRTMSAAAMIRPLNVEDRALLQSA
jgi:hypothetical protein